MGTKLSTQGNSSSVTVNVRGEKGQYFIGKLLAHKTAASAYKNEDGTAKQYSIYEFAVKDTNMETTRKDGKEYKVVDVAEGDSVSVFAPTYLNNALRQCEPGVTVKFVYLGLGKATKMGGKPHCYDAEIL